ncbi:hypothetical protein KGY14_02115 [Ameyamaea chiangmaiensis]|uniref:Uncharacterized protein n=1 Tax=Ameyamaea chiangmaiensis TaxID=442969 RepID=A0A850PEP0_9PROT|nr:hypothetical protein [Ameyamaea chiangmaiensis]MBS4073982.1 hypothetical protein [Ameyamaea chiangmaiensis]NVN40726.1 hypothetical protein [Ameyamaea chiangmaiensis]
MGFFTVARTVGASTAFALVVATAAPQAQAAMTAKACHQAFTDAKGAGTLNGQTYTAFKASHCADDAPAANTPTASPLNQSTAPSAAPGTAAAPAAPATPAPAATTSAPKAATTVASGNAVFPSAVSSKYSTLSAGKARMKTCLDQYHANKDAGGTGNGGLKWIQKGGGYYSSCNARLKG